MNHPIIIYKYSPLNSWNIVFKKSASYEKREIRVMEGLPDINILVAGDSKGNITFWTNSTYKLLYTLSNHKGPITSLCYLNDGKTVFGGGSDSRISKITFNVYLNKYNYVISTPEFGDVIGLTQAMDGETLLSAMENKIVYWDLQTCIYSKDFIIHEEDISAIF